MCISCLIPAAASSLQAHRFMSQKALTNLHDSEDPVATKDDKAKSDNTEKDVVQQKSVWTGVSDINHQVVLLLAAVWVLVLGSAPIMIYAFGGKQVTKSAIILSCLMWLALFGGLFLFTQIILFNSPHFERVRSLTIIECTYFMTQVITTVGYGDVTPAMPRGQVFVGTYVTLSFCVIAILVSEVQGIVMEKVNKYKEDLKQRHGYALTNSQYSSPFGIKPEKPTCDALLGSMALFVGIASVWVFFFHYYPGENKSWLEAIYMCLITLTTVGFGAITPITEGGMLFSAFFMFIGTSALVNVVQNFSTYILEMDQYESWCPKEFASDLHKYREKYVSGGDSGISEESFLILTLLQRKLVTEDQIDQVRESYKAMLGTKGKLNLKGIASKVDSQIDHADLGDSATEPATSARCPLSAR